MHFSSIIGKILSIVVFFVCLFVCFQLEGELSLVCYETIDRILASIAVENIPHVRAIAQRLSGQLPFQPVHEQ